MDLHDQPSSLLPLRGIRFSAELTGTIAATLGPPADIESSDEAEAFVRQRPFSAVRLEIEDRIESDASELRFTEARRMLERWLDDGVLFEDDVPSYYVYEQGFDDFGVQRVRRGIIGLVPVDAPNVSILPHEETWEENRQRRLQLLRDLHASISPVYLIYDGQRSPSTLIDRITARTPAAGGMDDSGETHRLWVVSDEDDHAAIRELMRDQHFIIADGHHRFAATQLYHQEHGELDTGLVLACCVSADEPGIVIRPIHRIVQHCDAQGWRAAAETLSQWFSIFSEPVDGRSGRELAASLSDADLPEVGVIVDAGLTFMRLTLKSWDVAEPLLPDEITGLARTLDVTVVTELLVRRALEIDFDAESRGITYTNDANEVLDSVVSGLASIGILVRPIRLSQVLAVAKSGGKVPAKSTSFIPKVPVGLVVHEFRADEVGGATGNRQPATVDVESIEPLARQPHLCAQHSGSDA
jgi:uncharacterized protein (DUF1015 family)